MNPTNHSLINKHKKIDGRAFWRFHKLPDLWTKVKGIKLKNCPFCGSKGTVFRKRYKGSVSYAALCGANGADGVTCPVRPQINDINDKRFKRARGVAAVWNKRQS